ncbi:MAG: fibronectin type III domain-containing protein, partial [Clostridia bacterium]|nr:fibronectin type III domain-containing protein [Clostridia bacterium]
SVIIPNSVESIGERAFSGCDQLKDVYYLGTEKQWKKISINSYNENLTEATIHYHKHEYVSSVIKEATCTEAGLTEFTCTCGKNYTKTIEEIPHTFTSYTSDGNATCIADGTKTAVCDVCNKAKDSVTDEGSKNNAEHKYSVRAGSSATCTDNGERIYVCDVCETATYTEIIPAIGGHSFVACLGEDPTCTEDGFIEYCCEVCESESYRETVPATGHDYDSVVTAPTCDSIGYTTHTCLDCGEVYTDTFVNANGHKGGTATCTQKARCSVCGEAYGSLKAHTYKTVTTKATLTKEGKIESKCSCGKVKSTQTIAKISSVTLSATKYIHDGKNKTPTVTVKDANGKTLVKNTDYKISVASSRKGVGKYTVKVTFIGKYEGTKNLYFTILPGKPASVKSAAQTTSSVKLTWSEVSGAAGYTVYRYSPSKKAYVKAGTTEGTSLTVKGLLAGTKYTFKVVAYGKTSGGKVYNSEGYTLLKTATKTKTPAISKITTTKGKAVLTHTNVSGETGYTVYYSTKKDSGFKKYANFKADTTTCNITKLTSGRTYYFKVRTYIKTDSGYVYSPWSAVKGIKVK